MDSILKKQIFAGIIDLITCAIPGVIVYFTSGLIEMFDYLNIINIFGVIYLIYTILGFLYGGRSPGDSFQGIILIKANTEKCARFSFLFKELFKIIFLFYLSLINLNDFTFGNIVIIFNGLVFLFPKKLTDGKFVYYSVFNFASKTIYKNITKIREK